MLAAIAVVGGVVWWFRGWMSEAEINGLKAEKSVLEQRLKLAADRLFTKARKQWGERIL
jgi:hypothetical protein